MADERHFLGLVMIVAFRAFVNALPTAAVGANLHLLQFKPMDMAVCEQEIPAGRLHIGAGCVVG